MRVGKLLSARDDSHGQTSGEICLRRSDSRVLGAVGSGGSAAGPGCGVNRGSTSSLCAEYSWESIGLCGCRVGRHVDPNELDGRTRGNCGWPVRPGAACDGRCGRHRVVNRDRRLLRSKPSQIRRRLRSRGRSFLFGVLFSFLFSLGVFLSGGFGCPSAH